MFLMRTLRVKVTDGGRKGFVGNASNAPARAMLWRRWMVFFCMSTLGWEQLAHVGAVGGGERVAAP